MGCVCMLHEVLESASLAVLIARLRMYDPYFTTQHFVSSLHYLGQRCKVPCLASRCGKDSFQIAVTEAKLSSSLRMPVIYTSQSLLLGVLWCLTCWVQLC